MGEEGSLERTVKKMLTNGQQQPTTKTKPRRRKASPAPQPPNSKSNLLENNSLVTSLRQAGSDREFRSKGQPSPQPPPPPTGGGPMDDLPHLPNSDSELAKQIKKIPTKARKDSSDSPLISKEASSPGSLRQRHRRRGLRPRQLGSEDEDLEEEEETEEGLTTDDEMERGGDEGD